MKDITIELQENVMIDKDKATLGKSVLKKEATKYYITKRKQ